MSRSLRQVNIRSCLAPSASRLVRTRENLAICSICAAVWPGRFCAASSSSSGGDEHGGVAHLVPREHPLRERLTEVRELVEGSPDADPFLGGRVGDAEHRRPPKPWRRWRRRRASSPCDRWRRSHRAARPTPPRPAPPAAQPHRRGHHAAGPSASARAPTESDSSMGSAMGSSFGRARRLGREPELRKGKTHTISNTRSPVNPEPKISSAPRAAVWPSAGPRGRSRAAVPATRCATRGSSRVRGVTIDVERARALTPGCEEVLHLNHAGASLLPQPVLDAVVGHLQLEARTGGYEAAAEAAPRSSARTPRWPSSSARHPSRSPCSTPPAGRGTWRCTRCRWSRTTGC